MWKIFYHRTIHFSHIDMHKKAMYVIVLHIGMFRIGSKLAHVSLQKIQCQYHMDMVIVHTYIYVYYTVFTVTLALVSWEFSQLLRKDHQYNVHSFSYICYTQSRWNFVQIQPSSFLKVRCTFFSSIISSISFFIRFIWIFNIFFFE